MPQGSRLTGKWQAVHAPSSTANPNLTTHRRKGREREKERGGTKRGRQFRGQSAFFFFFFFFFYLPTGLFLPAQPPILADTPTAPTSKTVRSSQKALSGKSHRLQSVRLSAKPFQLATEQAPEHQND